MSILFTPAEKNIGATIRIGREIRCLQNAGFFYDSPKYKMNIALVNCYMFLA